MEYLLVLVVVVVLDRLIDQGLAYENCDEERMASVERSDELLSVEEKMGWQVFKVFSTEVQVEMTLDLIDVSEAVMLGRAHTRKEAATDCPEGTRRQILALGHRT